MSDKSCPHCGGSLESGRSSPDHRRFFALIQAAFQQWPEDQDFQPDDSEHLRAWLLCKVGYRESKAIRMPAGTSSEERDNFITSIESAIRAADGVGFVVPYKSGVAVVKPKSMSFHKLGQREFSQLRDAVTDIIEAIIEVPADQLLRERAA